MLTITKSELPSDSLRKISIESGDVGLILLLGVKILDALESKFAHRFLDKALNSIIKGETNSSGGSVEILLEDEVDLVQLELL